MFFSQSFWKIEKRTGTNKHFRETILFSLMGQIQPTKGEMNYGPDFRLFWFILFVLG